MFILPMEYAVDIEKYASKGNECWIALLLN